MGQQIGVQMLFIKDLKQQLHKIQLAIQNVQQDINDIKQDMRFLTGKSIQQLIMYRYNQVINNPLFDKIYLQLNVHSLNNVKNISEFVMDFMNKDKKSVLVLTGLSGAGKSTFVKHLERKYLIMWKQSLEQNKEKKKEENILPILIQLSSV